MNNKWHSHHSGNSQGFWNPVPGTGGKTLYPQAPGTRAKAWNYVTCHQTSLKRATCLDFSLAPHHCTQHTCPSSLSAYLETLPPSRFCALDSHSQLCPSLPSQARLTPEIWSPSKTPSPPPTPNPAPKSVPIGINCNALPDTTGFASQGRPQALTLKKLKKELGQYESQQGKNL